MSTTPTNAAYNPVPADHSPPPQVVVVIPQHSLIPQQQLPGSQAPRVGGMGPPPPPPRTAADEPAFVCTECGCNGETEYERALRYDPSSWSCYCCYNRPDDPRFCVPKRSAWRGYTVNTATSAGKMFIALAILIPIASLTCAILGSQGVFGGRNE